MDRHQYLRQKKKTTNSTTVDPTNGWKSSPGKIYQRNAARARTAGLKATTRNRGAKRISRSTAKATWPTQRPQTCTEAATKCYNYTADEAGEERELRLPTLQDIRQRLRCTVKIILFDATIGGKGYTICTVHVKNIFPTDWVKPVSLHTMSNNGFYSKLYFTMNSLEHRYNVWHV